MNTPPLAAIGFLFDVHLEGIHNIENPHYSLWIPRPFGAVGSFHFSDEEVSEIMEKAFAFVTLIKPLRRVNLVKEDPDDNIIIECALESNSKYIITYDRHLLNLKEYQEIRIIKPEEARAIF